MPQNINLNVSPYFDDFDEDRNYQRVLFKPGTPIQARELTTLQSILQNQIQKFGSHFFKEGSMVIPGQIAYDNRYTCVEINDSHLGIPVSAYIDKLVGKRIKGETSQVIAKVENYITNLESEKSNYTLYIKYISSEPNEFNSFTFVDGETLITLDDIEYSLSIIGQNESFATTILSNSLSVGSAAKISEGVYFIRGFFVKVPTQTIILDQYSSTPSYRVGLNILEEFAVASNEYFDLYDNAKGFSNFAAPGADRLKISTNLIKKDIEDFNDENFIELLRVRDGKVEKFIDNVEYDVLNDELARRTYDESGDYIIRPFNINVKESLNDKLGNNGIYEQGQITINGNIASDNLACISLSPGKAYVRGYEIETENVLLDLEKPRSTKRVEEENLQFNSGNKITVNNVYGSIPVGFSSSSNVSLYSDRTITPGVPSGTLIGISKVYDYEARSSEYVGPQTEYLISLYDTQLFTKVSVNANTNLTAPVLIEGQNSGAKGFLYSDVNNNKDLLLYDVSGTFNLNEPIAINGIDDNKIITSIEDYKIGDVHQIVANENNVAFGTFTSDTVLSKTISISNNVSGTFSISSGSGTGVSTITSPNINYSVLSVGDIISYTKPSDNIITYNKIIELIQNTNQIIIESISNVSNVCTGTVPSSEITLPNVLKVEPLLIDSENNFYYKLSNENISNVDLSNTSIVIKRTFTDINVDVSEIVYELANDFLSFDAFDEDNYNLTYVNSGNIVSLKEFENIRFSQDRKTVIFSGLTEFGPVLFTATCRLNTATARKKFFNRCNSIVINGSNTIMSGVGATTLDDGLTYNEIYGLRVQDKEISLNIPDVVKILGVYESSHTTDPQIPKLIISNLTSSILNATIGEKIVGTISNAVGFYVSNLNNSTIEFVEANDNNFIPGETILFQESQISANVEEFYEGDKNITSAYLLDNGYRKEYLDFSRIIRKASFSSPTKKIRVVFNNYSIAEGNVGDFVVVNSYDADRYKEDLPLYGEIYSSDIIDIRPSVLPYSGNRSPFESSSRKFTNTSGSSPHIFSTNTTLSVAYDYYLPRVDKLFLDRFGNFILKTGIPSIDFGIPQSLNNALEIATLSIPSYLRDVRDVDITINQHKRYTMKDISNLENKINNIEQYTLLSLLEQDTKNLTLRDEETGLDKFKSGFLVDNFKNIDGGDIGNVDYKSDSEFGTLRSSGHITSIDLMAGIESLDSSNSINLPTTDYFYSINLGTNDIKRVGNILCLNYNEVEFIKNIFATRVENVNPFNVITWTGLLKLNPSSDNWLETKKTGEDKIIGSIEGNYLDTLRRLNANPNTGLSPIQWEAWKTAWTGIISKKTSVNTEVRPRGVFKITSTTKTIASNLLRSDIQFRTKEVFDTVSLGDRVVSSSSIGFMRSRNIEIVGKRLKPLTRFYAFFDNKNVTEYIVPKLLNIRMRSGIFIPGETVTGIFGSKQIRFKVAPQNHKYGPIDNTSVNLPQNYEIDTYKINVYSPSNSLSSSYSTTSTILNVDTSSLSATGISGFFGCISEGMTLTGTSSKAVAVVRELKLISDDTGTFIGTLFIPDSRNPSSPKFETGTKELVLTTSQTNSKIFSITSSYGIANFTSSGVLNSIESTSLRLRNASVDPLLRTDTNTVIKNVTSVTSRKKIRHIDPLAQSFLVDDEPGVFITKCDIFFASKDTNNIPITLQIRTVELGVPTQTILPFSEVILPGNKVNISSNSRVATTFFFESPVYLEGGKEYAIVLISPSDDYTVWISRMGEIDISTSELPENDRIIVSQQPLLGSLFKSQNASEWTPSQLEDLKFTLHRAEFTSTLGSVRLYNSDLNIGNQQIKTLSNNPIQSYSRSMIVSIGKTFTNSDIQLLVPGATITQQENDYFRSDLVSVVGSIGIGSTLEIIEPGTGFGSLTTSFTNVDLISTTGIGNGAKAEISVTNGIATTVTITEGGTGYINGDILNINVNSTDQLGRDLLISIPTEVGIITEFNSLLLDNVQGVLKVNTETNIVSNGSTIQSSPVNSPINLLSDGLHMKVTHDNHGMYSYENFVTISGIEPDVLPQRLTSDISSNSSESTITVNDVTIFSTFENLPVNLNNPGYILINKEIIKYTGVDEISKTLTGVTRSSDCFNIGDDPLLKIAYYPQSHTVGDNVYKYEFNGVSLRRINRTHNMNLVDKLKYPINIDNYHIKLDMSSTDSRDRVSGDDTLYFTESKFGGIINNSLKVGFGAIDSPKATQNIVMTSVLPNIQTLLPENTKIDAKLRTISGTSVSGNEKSFVDTGFLNVSLESETVFDTPRLICSKINESQYLSSLPGKKSVTMELTMSTSDSKVSPVVDLDRVSLDIKMNRLDSPVLDYITDKRINQIGNDPHSCVYVSRLVMLENPANELKVYFDAYKHISNDIRVAYKLIRDNIPPEQQIYELFPGFKNLNKNKEVIRSSNNDGSSDSLISNSININDYKEYEYTAKNIPLFNGFQIKIMMSGKNQCISPLIKNFRVLALR